MGGAAGSFWNPMSQALDEFEEAHMNATPEGLACDVVCSGCGTTMPIVEPWTPQTDPRTGQPSSSVHTALSNAPAPLRSVVQFAKQRLAPGQGFSYCVIDDEKNLAFCVFIKCPVCPQEGGGHIAVGEEQLHKVKSYFQQGSK